MRNNVDTEQCPKALQKNGNITFAQTKGTLLL